MRRNTHLLSRRRRVGNDIVAMTHYFENLRHCRSACPFAGAHNGTMIPCRITGVDTTSHARASFCPHPGSPRFGTREAPEGWPLLATPIESLDEQLVATVHALWDEFHSWPLNMLDVAGELARLHNFADGVRKLGCACGTHWDTLIKAYPPDLTSPFNYAVWQWNMHNDVNIIAAPPKPRIAFMDAAKVRGWESLLVRTPAVPSVPQTLATISKPV